MARVIEFYVPQDFQTDGAMGAAGSTWKGSRVPSEIDTEAKATSVTIRLPQTTETETKESNAMIKQSITSKQDTEAVPRETATYFGLTVQVIARMANYGLVRYRDRELVVETADLRTSLAVGRAA